jgi:hypothetical protein
VVEIEVLKAICGPKKNNEEFIILYKYKIHWLFWSLNTVAIMKTRINVEKQKVAYLDKTFFAFLGIRRFFTVFIKAHR